MTPEGQRLALIVASSEFTDSTLQQLVAPGRDAADLAGVLEDAQIGGFEVTVLANRPSYEVRREIEAFFASRKRDDLLLLYFSGHGVKDDDGRLYLATSDTRRGLFRSTAVPATFVNETMTASRSRRQVLILDCCHSGAFARGMVAKGGESVDIRDRFEGRGRVVLTASNATQYAFQGDEIIGIGEGSRSVFTRHLVRGLETGEADLDGDGWVSLDELYDYVYDRVTDETPRQTPGKWAFDLRGEIIIARNPRWAVKLAELPPELQQAIESPFAGVREGAVRELDRLLRGSLPGLALAAHNALTRLAGDDSRRVATAAAASLAAYAEAEQEARSKKQEEAEAERFAAQKAEAARRARELLRHPWHKLVPNWVWVVSGVIVLVLLCAGVTLGPRLWETITAPTEAPAERPTAVPTEAPTEAPTAQPTATEAPTAAPTEELTPSAGNTWTRPADGMVMVYMPAGEFEMGSTELYGEQPVHTVALDGFWIDQTEVTNGQFAVFLNEQGNQTDGGVTWLELEDEDCLIERVGSEYRPKSGYADHPVIEVSWYGAAAYCDWAGVRLPTEAEWEKAARGTDGRKYPWGDSAPDCDKANYYGCVGLTTAVGSYPAGASWCDALDMAGNVWEWVADWYGGYPSGRQVNPSGRPSGEYRVLRGGSWVAVPDNGRCAARGWSLPDSSNNDFGFRCARGSE